MNKRKKKIINRLIKLNYHEQVLHTLRFKEIDDFIFELFLGKKIDSDITI